MLVLAVRCQVATAARSVAGAGRTRRRGDPAVPPAPSSPGRRYGRAWSDQRTADTRTIVCFTESPPLPVALSPPLSVVAVAVARRETYPAVTVDGTPYLAPGTPAGDACRHHGPPSGHRHGRAAQSVIGRFRPPVRAGRATMTGR